MTASPFLVSAAKLRAIVPSLVQPIEKLEKINKQEKRKRRERERERVREREREREREKKDSQQK